MAENFDVVVIGAGPAGYVAAIRAAQLKQKVAIVDKQWMGGVCLNVGCIPSKALLSSSHHYAEIAHFEENGIEITGEVKVNLEKMIARKQAVVDQTSGGINYLMDKNKVTVFNGLASIVSELPSAFVMATCVASTKEPKPLKTVTLFLSIK